MDFPVTVYGQVYEFSFVAEQMDFDLYQKVERQMTPCPEQKFIEAYLKLHAAKHGTPFVVRPNRTVGRVGAMAALDVIYRTNKHGGIEAFVPETSSYGKVGGMLNTFDTPNVSWTWGDASLDYYRKCKPYRGPVPKALEDRVAYNGPEPPDRLRRRYRLNWKQLRKAWRV